MYQIFYIICLIIFSFSTLFSQVVDSVDVTFFYKPSGNPSVVYLPGEFNNWGNNSGGIISDPKFAMIKEPITGIWSKTERLRVGGPVPLPNPGKSIPGAYQYKFNENGSSSGWLPDPLNPRQNSNDNNNSYLFIKDPTIHYLLPNSTEKIGVLRTRLPEISAYIFPSLSTTIDTDSIMIKIDTITYTNLGQYYELSDRKLSFTPSNPLGDGLHTLILLAKSANGSQGSDTTIFEVQANVAQILTKSADTWKDQWRMQGAFFNSTGGYDTTVTIAQIFRPDTAWNVSVNNGQVDTVLALIEDDNIFRLRADIGGQTQISDSVNIHRKVNLNPRAQIDFIPSTVTIDIQGGNSLDPNGLPLTYLWREDPDNPELLGINGMTTSNVTVGTPPTLGEYYVELMVENPDAKKDSTRAFFTIQLDSPQVKIAGYADNSSWLKEGRIYLMFFKAFTSVGTIRAAIPNLEYIKAMGFNIIWVLPVMEIPGNVDNQINIGYNIIDFIKVEQSYGSDQDFKDFVNEAHQFGLKVILDVTPNHSGKDHPFAQEATLYQDFSPYWNYYQTVFISHNTNGLSQCVTPQGIYYYCGFSDALLNYNWSDLDARNYMIDVYKYWINNFKIDGYRFDVYWGPHRRYGNSNFGIPMREEIKHIKPDVLLLGEDSGTGTGTEVIYAENGGGLDMAYDFKLYFNQIRDFTFTPTGVNGLHNELDNGGFYPGENSYYLRFMENQDEDRISYEYDSFIKTMPMATTIFTAPGTPLMYNGQEVGFGRGMGNPGEPDLNDRRRGIIDWNFAGKSLLQPHYQKLAQIRSQFKAFSQHKKDSNGDGQINAQDESDFIRLTTNNGRMYAFMRPYMDENGITIGNFSNSNQSVIINPVNYLKFSSGFNVNDTYWVNNLYMDTSYQVLGVDLFNFTVSLPAYGSVIYVISNEQKSVILPPLPPLVGLAQEEHQITQFQLSQNYPNPFNPATTIEFSIPKSGKVNLKIFNILGEEVANLISGNLSAGKHFCKWNAGKFASGIYFYRLEAVYRDGENIQTRRMLLLK